MIDIVEFETMGSKEIKFGKNKFLEVARKRVKTEEGESEIISLSKGTFTPSGQKMFKQGFGFPADKELVDSLVEALGAV